MRQRVFTGLMVNGARWISASAAAGPRPSRLSGIRAGAFAFAVGAGGAGSFYAYQEYKRQEVKTPVAVLNETDKSAKDYILASAPDFKPSRSVIYPNDTTGLKLTLYQYQTCPFCCKVRAMLDFFGISYNIVEVNPVLRTQLKWSEKYRKVPILIVETPEGEVFQLKDSSMIISALCSYLNKTQANSKGEHEMLEVVKCYPSVKFQTDDGQAQTDIMNKYFLLDDISADNSKEAILEERKWRKWADSVYVHTLSPNIYRTVPEAIDSFRNFDRVGEWDKNFAAWERTLVIYVGAFAMWMIGKKLQKRHHLKPDVRQSLYDESNHWLASIKKNGKPGDFMGGVTPNLSDLAVYGVLSSIEGCEAFSDLEKNSKIIKQWYRKVQEHLKTTAAAAASAQ